MIFKKVKSSGIHDETFLEHAIRTYKVGEFLWDEIGPIEEVEREHFLYSCFFHDVGKLLTEKFGSPHTPITSDALDQLKETEYYEALLQNFELPDLSEDEDVLNAITAHHDSDSELGLYTALADHIASSTSNEDLKDRLASTVVTVFNEIDSLKEWNFYNISIPSFSKNELNAVGKLLMLKLLYETIDELDEIKLLYETLQGCRVVTPLKKSEVLEKISCDFNQAFVEFVKAQDISDFLGGAPDAYKQYATFPKEAKQRMIELVGERYMQKIVDAVKGETIEDVGIEKDKFLDFAGLDDLKDFSPGIAATKYKLLSDADGYYRESDVERFGLSKNKVDGKINNGTVPRIEKLLEKVDVEPGDITYKKDVYNNMCSMTSAICSLKKSDVDFSFDISKYIAIDGDVDLEKLAEENVCANCGTFEGVIPLPPFTLGIRQHFRESLFRAKNSQIRKGEILLCELCHSETLLNSLMSGTIYESRQNRINPHTHLVVYGLDMDRDILEDIADEEFITTLKNQYRITEESIYVKEGKDLQIAFYSLAEYNVGIKNERYKEILFSTLCSKIKDVLPLTVSFSVNKLPNRLENDIIQMKKKDVPFYPPIIHDYFSYVFVNVWGNYEDKRDYILKYYNKPFIGLCQIFKRGHSKYNEKTHRMVNKLSENDKMYEIADKIWDMAKLGGALETKRNVGSFLGVFKGRPEDLDKLTNRILKNEKIPKAKRGSILDIFDELREMMKNLSGDEQRELKDYIQKTKYLFNSKKFYEIQKAKEE